jgi:hypothetical protein
MGYVELGVPPVREDILTIPFPGMEDLIPRNFPYIEQDESPEPDTLTFPMFPDEDEDITREEKLMMEVETLRDCYESSYLKHFNYVAFVSESSGRNRKRRRAREIELVGVSKDRFVMVKDGGGRLDRYTVDGIDEETLVEDLRQRDQRLQGSGLKIRHGIVVACSSSH